MKNATAYEKKIRKLLSSMPKAKMPVVETDQRFAFLISAMLQADTAHKAVAGVLSTFDREFVDYNELRVAPAKDIADCIGREFPYARDKAQSIIRSLNGIFDHTSSMSMEYMEKMPKRDLRKHLQEVGLSSYAASLVTLVIFGGHAVPVDSSLIYLLEKDEYIAPGSEATDVQGFLERVIGQKDAYNAHEFFRGMVDAAGKILAKKRKEEEAAALARPGAPVKQDQSLQEQMDMPMDEFTDDEAAENAMRFPTTVPAVTPKSAKKPGARGHSQMGRRPGKK